MLQDVSGIFTHVNNKISFDETQLNPTLAYTEIRFKYFGFIMFISAVKCVTVITVPRSPPYELEESVFHHKLSCYCYNTSKGMLPHTIKIFSMTIFK